MDGQLVSKIGRNSMGLASRKKLKMKDVQRCAFVLEEVKETPRGREPMRSQPSVACFGQKVARWTSALVFIGISAGARGLEQLWEGYGLAISVQVWIP